ncbi:MAG: acyltransferase family protein [Candidatus Sericytochromatia bacterium]
MSGENMALPVPARRFTALDAIRGLAALTVIFHHLQPSFAGYLAVDLFFVLSGFVLAYRYFDRAAISLADFAVVRLARLYPLHLFTLVIISMMYVLTDSTPEFPDGVVNTFVQHLLLMHNLGLSTGRLAWNEASWSISVEFWVNLIVCAWLSRARSFLLLMLSLASFALLITQVGCICATFELVLGWLNAGLVRCFGSFLLGMLVFRLYTSLRRQPSLPAAGLSLSLLEGLSLAVSVAVILLTPWHSHSDLMAPLVFAGLILVFAFDGGALSRLMALLRLDLLGSLSYSLYLNHFWMLVWYRQMGWPAFGVNWDTFLYYLLPVFAVSTLTLWAIEKPFQRATLGIWKQLREEGARI